MEKRNHVAALSGYIILSLILTYPLIFHFFSHLPAIVDPQVSGNSDRWGYFWLFWQFEKSFASGGGIPQTTIDIFYPLGIQMPLMHMYSYYAVIFIPLKAVFNSVVAWNTLILSAFVMSAFGMYLLCHELTHNRLASFIGGVIFAFCPYHFARIDAHITLMTSQWIPFNILFLFRTINQKGYKNPLWAGLFLLLQFFSSSYYFVMLLLFNGVVLVFLTLKRNRPVLSKAFLKRYGVMLSVTVLPVCFFMLHLFLTDSRWHYLFTSLEDPHRMGADLISFWIPSIFNPILGKVANIINLKYPRSIEEGSVYLGIVPFLLSLYAVFIYSKKKHIGFCFWVFSASIFFILTLGAYLSIGGKGQFGIGGFQFKIPLPYYVLQFIPFLKGIRAPIRFDVLFMLSVGVLCAFGSLLLYERLARKKFLKNFLMGLILIFVLLEYNQLPLSIQPINIPNFYNQLAKEKDDFAILELPFSNNENQIYQFYQTVHRKRLLYGNLARIPGEFAERFRIDRISECLYFPTMVQQPENIFKNRSESDNFLYFYNLKYIIIHKRFLDINGFKKIESIVSNGLAKQAIFEDSDIIVYRTKDIAKEKTITYKSRGWAKRENQLIYNLLFDEDPAAFNISGFSDCEMYGAFLNDKCRWSLGKSSSISIVLPYPESYAMHLFLRPFETPETYSPGFDLYINQKYHSTILLQRPKEIIPFNEYRIETDKSYWKSGINRIEFRYKETFKPIDLSISNNQRELSVAFFIFQLKIANIAYNWSIGDTSNIQVHFPKPYMGSRIMKIGMRPFDFGEEKRQSVDIFFNQKHLKTIQMLKGFHEYQVLIPSIKSADNRIKFKYAHFNEDKGIDKRKLGIALYYLNFDGGEEKPTDLIAHKPSHFPKDILFKEGWDLATNNSTKIMEWFTLHNGVIEVRSSPDNRYLKIKGNVRLPEDQAKCSVYVYINDKKEHFDITTSDEPFMNYFRLKKDALSKSNIILFQIDPPILAHLDKTAGLFIHDVDLIQETEVPFYFFEYGWYDHNYIPGLVNKRTIERGTIKIQNIGKDIILPINGYVRKINRQIDSMRFFINGSEVDRVGVLNDNQTISRHFILESEQFHNQKWCSLAVRLYPTGLASESSDTDGFFIGKIEVEKLNHDKVFSGWYTDRWIGNDAICYIKNINTGTKIHIEGKTAIKFFKDPITVSIFLDENMIDQFTLKNTIKSRIKMKLSGMLFSKTYIVNNENVNRKWNRLRITCDKSFIPDKFLSNGDKRNLCLFIPDIQIAR